MSEKVGAVELSGNGVFVNKDNEEMVPKPEQEEMVAPGKKNFTCID